MKILSATYVEESVPATHNVPFLTKYDIMVEKSEKKERRLTIKLKI